MSHHEDPAKAIAIIEAVKQELGTDTDKGLADFLGIAAVNIATVRAGKSRFGIVPRIKLYDRYAMTKIEKLIKDVLPTRFAAGFEHWIHSIVNSQIRSKIYSDGELLELFKSFQNFQSDQALSEALGIGRSTISMVRKGRTKLGFRPKKIIIRSLLEDSRFHDVDGLDLSEFGVAPDDLANIDFDLLDKVIEDDEALLNLIKSSPRSN